MNTNTINQAEIEKFNKMTKQANVPEDFIILRDRWYDKYNAVSYTHLTLPTKRIV